MLPLAQISHPAASSGLSGGGSWRWHALRRVYAMSAQRRLAFSGGFVPVEPARRPVLFINPTSGGGKAQRARLADLARERGIEPVTLAQGDELEAFIQGAVADDADGLGVAGGDGSLALVASAAAARRISFVCVPAGTRNHFARDVGVDPNDLFGALDAFSAALERTIDLGSVNGRPFLNNVSLGIYGDAVQRGDYRGAMLRTLLETADEEALGSGSASAEVHLVDDRGCEHHSPAVVLVSNNPYALGLRRAWGTPHGRGSDAVDVTPSRPGNGAWRLLSLGS